MDKNVNRKWNLITHCINLTSRKDRKRKMKQLIKTNETLASLNIKYFNAKLNKIPKQGCINSHLSIIKSHQQKYQHRSSTMPSLFILEDDIKIVNDFKLPDINELPSDWDMLYFGGTVKDVYTTKMANSKWVRISSWNTHAYIINMNNEELVNDILKLELENKNESKNNSKKDSFANSNKEFMEIDKFYLNEIHPKYNCYMSAPMPIIQCDGYSDIEKAEVNYDFMEGSLTGFKQPEHKVNEKGEYILKLGDINCKEEDLPTISIITPTKNRRNFFPLALTNYENFNYPRHKIEWIIIEQLPTDEEDAKQFGLWDLLPRKQRINLSENENDDTTERTSNIIAPIKYMGIRTNEKMSIAQIRNMCVSVSTGSIIIHMDDDDYYPSESVMTRVKTLLKYKKENIGLVGCSKIGVYNLNENMSTISSDGILSISEASMGYWKSFWEKQNFNVSEFKGEYASFIGGRFDEIIDIPYSFIIIATKHKSNYTQGTKSSTVPLKNKKDGTDYNFSDEWDDEIKDVFSSILARN